MRTLIGGSGLQRQLSDLSRKCFPTSILTPKSKGRFMWLYASASCSMEVRSGACGRTYFRYYAASIKRCCRIMCRITMAHTIRHHISSADLLEKLGLNPLDTYYHRRLLRWAGHVSRMPMSRAPRQLLTGWVAHKRPIGCPQMTWGRTIKKALVRNNLPGDFKAWSSLAADREHWRSVCGTKQHSPTHMPPPNTPRARWIALTTD